MRSLLLFRFVLSPVILLFHDKGEYREWAHVGLRAIDYARFAVDFGCLVTLHCSVAAYISSCFAC
jgi:hypothetical protein